jgi:hypothetical protein
MQLLSSRTLKPSHTESFVDAWTSSLEDSLVNPSQLREFAKAWKIHDTCSHTSQKESGNANLELFSSKMLKESSPPKPQTENQFSSMSSDDWKNWVTEQRQEYSQRVKSAHLIRESESSSWATPNTMDHLEAGISGSFKESQTGRRQRSSNLRDQVVPPNWPTSRTSDAEGGRIETEITPTGFRSKRHQSDQYFGAKLRDAVETHEETVETHEENWPTATTRDWKDSTSTVPPSRANPSKQTLGQRVAHVGLLNQGSPNTNGKHQESWATPRANKVHPTITEENREQLANRGKSNLEEDVAGHWE